MLAALAGLAPPAEILAAFALYRLIYQVLPLAVAAAGLALAEGAGARRARADGGGAEGGAGLAPPVLATMALVLGAMLVFSGVTPAQPDRPRLARELPAAARDRGRALPRERPRGAPAHLRPRPRLPRRRGVVGGDGRGLRRARPVAPQGGRGLRGGGAGALRRGAVRGARGLRPPLGALRAAADAAVDRRGRGGARSAPSSSCASSSTMPSSAPRAGCASSCRPRRRAGSGRCSARAFSPACSRSGRCSGRCATRACR